jgi:hypothetical protein
LEVLVKSSSPRMEAFSLRKWCINKKKIFLLWLDYNLF